MTILYRKVVDVGGDRVEVHWIGPEHVWVSPHNNQQHATARQAMRCELEWYYRACGEDLEAENTAQEINGHVARMVDAD